MCFVRLLKHWDKEQTMQIKWGKHFSEPFHVSNGVRQGGVLSPYMFAVYLDDLSNELNNIKVGCYIGDVLFTLWRPASFEDFRKKKTPQPAMSNPNGLLSQKFCHYLNQGRTLNNILMRTTH